MTALFYIFQATGGSWRRQIPDSKGFCKELFGWVECYKESVGQSFQFMTLNRVLFSEVAKRT